MGTAEKGRGGAHLECPVLVNRKAVPLGPIVHLLYKATSLEDIAGLPNNRKNTGRLPK